MDKNRLWTHVALVLGGGALALGIWCAYAAWLGHSESLGLCGAALILAAPGIAVAALLAGQHSMSSSKEAPVPQLIDCIESADRLLRTIRLARASVFIAISYAVVLWYCQLTGMISARTFVKLYTILCALAAAGYLPWLGRSEKPAQADRENCRILLAEFKIDRGRFIS